MLVAASVCPHPPVLVPAVAGGAASELDELRTACVNSVRRMTQEGVDRVVVVGAAADPGEWDGEAGGRLSPFGVDVSVGGAHQVLPLSLTIGCYLLDEVGWPRAQRIFVAVADDASPSECAAVGERVLAQADQSAVGLLVMGDGSAKRSPTSPGYVDDRALPYDHGVVSALEKADLDALLALTPEPARDLWVAGRPAWQVLAGATRSAYPTGDRVAARVRYDDAPYGVGYWVVDWTFDPA